MTIALAYNSPEMVGAQRHGPRRSRPLSVTLVTWGVFILGLANAWRALALYRQSDLLLELGTSLDPRVRLLLALIWAAVFVSLAISLWRRWTTARFLTPALILIYTIYELGISSLFALSTESLKGLPANLAIVGAAIAFSVWALNRKAARQYFEARK
jgi:ABC-type enterochelin transport system permease subunit